MSQQPNVLDQLHYLTTHEHTRFNKAEYLKNKDNMFKIERKQIIDSKGLFQSPSFFLAPPEVTKSEYDQITQVLRYQSRELHLRSVEQCMLVQQLQIQRRLYRQIVPQIGRIKMPEDITYLVHQLTFPTLPQNEITHKNFIQQAVDLQHILVEHINKNLQNNIAVTNRIKQLFSILGENYKPSQVKQTEKSRRQKPSNIIQMNLHLDSLSQERIFDLLFAQFREQNSNQPIQAHFSDVLTKLSEFYMQIFAKQGVTETDVQQTQSFEDILYQKIHSGKQLNVTHPASLRPSNCLKSYQVDCLKFLASMYNSQAVGREPSIGKVVPGVCVADDMGLGKTLQTIAFLAYLNERKLSSYFHLIISPLAVSENWLREFKHWNPNYNIIVYKGLDREKLRHEIVSRKNYYQAIITTYDYVIQDRTFFRRLIFDVVVIDEAARIKNCQSKLINVLRNDIVCKFRLLLSGTPLQNNLKELFTLLQFIHGTVFHQYEQFDLIFGKIFKRSLNHNQSQIENKSDTTTVLKEEEDDEVDETDPDITELKDSDLETEVRQLFEPDNEITNEVSQTTSTVTKFSLSYPNQTPITKQEEILFSDQEKIFIISRLHGIIKPFMIRRTKVDVLDQLPPKEEIIIRCQLSGLQQHLYQIAILEAGRILENQDFTQQIDSKVLPKHFIRNVDMYLRRVCNHPYLGLAIDQLKLLYYYLVSQSEKFMNQHLSENSVFAQKQRELEQLNALDSASQLKYIQNLFIQNQLWRYSGKLEVLNRMLYKFKAAGHRILLFSQFKHVLDILQDFMISKEYSFLRFDGDVKDINRIKMVNDFNQQDSKYFIFLLSTRAAGHGLNLQSADTVIIYDCDFNAFYDLQAQDRAYRIGQTKSVKVFKFYTNTKLEQKMLNIAQSKLQLAQTIIEAGGLSGETQSNSKTSREMLLEILKSGDLFENEGEILSEDELNRAIARNDTEYRMFQELEQKTQYEWNLYNFSTLTPLLDPVVPEIFIKNNQLSSQLTQKYFIDQVDEFIIQNPQPTVKRGRGRPKKLKETIYEYDPEKEQKKLDEQKLLIQQKEEFEKLKQIRLLEEQQLEIENPFHIKALPKQQIQLIQEGSSSDSGSSEISNNSAVMNIAELNVADYTNEDIFFSFASKLKNIVFLENPHQFMSNLVITKNIVAVLSISKYKCQLKYLGDDIVMRLLEDHKYPGVNFIEVMSGLQMQNSDFLMIITSLSEQHSNLYKSLFYDYSYDCQFQDFSLYQSFVADVNEQTILFKFNPETLKLLTFKYPFLTDAGRPSKHIVQFHVRLLFVIHAMCVFTDENSHYYEENYEIQKNNSLPYHALQPFWTLPTIDEFDEYYKVIKYPISVRLIWFKVITLQYISLYEFVRDWKLVFGNAQVFNPKNSPLHSLSKDLYSYFIDNLMCIFDVDDVNDVLDYFRDCEKTVKLERRCYPILKEHIGFGIFDVLEIRDEITKYSVYHISQQSKVDSMFGAGCYGGDYYEHLIWYMVQLRQKMEYAKQVKV